MDAPKLIVMDKKVLCLSVKTVRFFQSVPIGLLATAAELEDHAWRLVFVSMH